MWQRAVAVLMAVVVYGNEVIDRMVIPRVMHVEVSVVVGTGSELAPPVMI